MFQSYNELCGVKYLDLNLVLRKKKITLWNRHIALWRRHIALWRRHKIKWRRHIPLWQNNFKWFKREDKQYGIRFTKQCLLVYSVIPSSFSDTLLFLNDIVHFTISGVYAVLSSQIYALHKNQIIYSFDKRNWLFFFKIYQTFLIETNSARIINFLHLSDLFISFYNIW
jgi:hypothetical protein